MSSPRRAVLVAPFWGRTGHVGVYRVDRFLRWLADDGVEVVLVRAASRDWVIRHPWGVEIAVADPLNFYPAPTPGRAIGSERKPSRLRRSLALGLLLPDPSVFWAFKASTHPEVLRHADGAAWVLSSSPPESVHVAAARLASRLNAGLVVDMRDGWLDEPTRSSVRDGWRRWLQGSIEGWVLRRADRILVTSDRWKELLAARRPAEAARTVVLTNGYPLAFPEPASAAPTAGKDPRLTLLHAGRFTGSRDTQQVGSLLAPLHAALGGVREPATIRLLGALEPDDLAAVAQWVSPFEAIGCSVRADPAVPREEMLARLGGADGLLLLAASLAPIPSKLFEYLPSGRPILAITPAGSAVWDVTEGIGQVFRFDPANMAGSLPRFVEYLQACRERDRSYPLPVDFTETHLAARFRHAVAPLGSKTPADGSARASGRDLVRGVDRPRLE